MLKNGLIGEWKLIEMYSDPGDGIGTFYPVDNNKRIEFKSSREYVLNGTFCHLSIESNQSSSGIYSISEKTISPTICGL